MKDDEIRTSEFLLFDQSFESITSGSGTRFRVCGKGQTRLKVSEALLKNVLLHVLSSAPMSFTRARVYTITLVGSIIKIVLNKSYICICLLFKTQHYTIIIVIFV